MLKSLMLGICTLAMTLPAFAQAEGPPLNRAKMPVDASRVSDFVPSGWLIEAQASGDLNHDQLQDLAVKLIQVKPAGSDDTIKVRHRALLLLFKRPDGKWHRAALAEHLLQCTACGGAFYGVMEAPANIKIANGILIVEQDYGSRKVTEQLFRFRYEAKHGKFFLIGYDMSDRDRATGEFLEESSNYLTGKKIVTKSRIDEKSEKVVTVSNQTVKIPKTRQGIEDVNYENR